MKEIMILAVGVGIGWALFFQPQNDNDVWIWGEKCTEFRVISNGEEVRRIESKTPMTYRTVKDNLMSAPFSFRGCPTNS